MYKLFYISLLIRLIRADFDPTKFDYCKITCEGFKHSACGCVRNKDVDELTDHLVEFRQKILNLHNNYRDIIASGEAINKNKAVEGAADMYVLNYDLELEYIARCFAHRYDDLAKPHHDKCRKLHNKDMNAGQNIVQSTAKQESPTSADLITAWYLEISYPEVTTELIDKFTGGGHSGHFTQMAWAKAKYLGCAQFFNPNARTEFKFGIICNYMGDEIGGNLIGEKIYTRGKACSACPADAPTCADDTYKNLCGKSLPVPTAPLPELSGTVETVARTRICYLFLFIFIMLY